MSLQNIHPRTTALVALILLAAAFRLVQSSPVFSILSNLTPFGAMALFGGHYFKDKWKAMLVPVIALWLSDIFLNRFYYTDQWVFFYGGQLWVYGTFAATVGLGMLMGKPTALRITGFGIGAALLHWLVTDFGVWIGGSTDITTGLPFTRDWTGFIKCLTLALPFLRNMIIGNLVFCGVLFGAFEYAQRRYPVLSK
ncbi:MAG: hypothetical protein JNL40_06190 [Cyclobacteriaceae bacterium]|nr:hypothetical protein [Cyclobacteriaceae bacterium]